jgi:hypothetical protein
MRLLLFALLLPSAVLHAQNGYVRLTNDSIISGYVRFYTSIEGQQGLEVWKTKRDKNPRRIATPKIYSFAIGKDTFRVLRQFKPFGEGPTYYEEVLAKVLVTGSVNLYSVPPPAEASAGVAAGGVVVSLAMMDPNLSGGQIYVLERPSTGYIRAISAMKEPMREALRDFFPDAFISTYEVKGRIKYGSVPEMAKKYNGRK